MSEDDVRRVVAIYRESLSSIVPYESANTEARYPTMMEGLKHARFMCDEIDKILEEPANLDKAFRWLGFLQAILWTHGIFSIDDMRNHIRAAGHKT